VSHEKEHAQKIVIVFLYVAFVLLITLPPLDFRFGWSRGPWYVSVLGDVLACAAFRADSLFPHCQRRERPQTYQESSSPSFVRTSSWPSGTAWRGNRRRTFRRPSSSARARC
jgi:protein-S-isoprenylcysteine O-methyltransferase Ste14